ncbi:hypothetical protein B0O80DRAFT_502183 [Mortierella sp. GBAus27b]|nr:hypothetical protein B0O80DRAFT_502183 [Mortierella sp. GBAus27b]
MAAWSLSKASRQWTGLGNCEQGKAGRLCCSAKESAVAPLYRHERGCRAQASRGISVEQDTSLNQDVFMTNSASRRMNDGNGSMDGLCMLLAALDGL